MFIIKSILEVALEDSSDSKVFIRDFGASLRNNAQIQKRKRKVGEVDNGSQTEAKSRNCR